VKSDVVLRQMTPADLPLANSLREMAGWNQTLTDWSRLLALAPRGCFVAEWGGLSVGTATTISYGEQLAWIGMLLVHPDFRGRGIGRALLQRCLDHLHSCGLGCIQLDATAQGQPIYERSGFQKEWSLTRWEISRFATPASANPGQIRSYQPSDIGRIESLDAKAFGAARPELLASLLRESRQGLVHESSEGVDAYGVLREGARAFYLGPLAAGSPGTGGLLVNALLGCAGGKAIYWDIPDANLEAVALARNLGFTPQRSLVRMYLGSRRNPGDLRQYFAIAGPSVG